jgi:Bacteriophage tail sheath protein
MANVTYPGVYMEEVSSGVRPITAAGTSTTAFVGVAEMGPDDKPIRVTSWTEFQKYYGSFIPGSYLAESVFQFFNNGGSQAYIVRVTRSDSVAADVSVNNRAATVVESAVSFTAKSKGAWGNYLYLQIEDGTADPRNTCKISIRKQDLVEVVPEDFADITPLEIHDNLSMDPELPSFIETVINMNSNLIDASVLSANDSTQAGFHQGGFNPPGLIDAMTAPKFQINLNDDGYQVVTLTDIAADTTIETVAGDIETKVKGLTEKKSSTDDNAFLGFTCSVETDATYGKYLLLTSGTPSTYLEMSSVKVLDNNLDNIAALLKIGDANGGQSEGALAVRRPANADAIQLGDSAEDSPPVKTVTLGEDGVADLSILNYSGQFTLLDNVTDFSLLAVPGIGTSVMIDEGMNYCRNRPLQDVFYIGEMTQDDDEASEAETFRKQLTSPNSYGAVYFPWIKALDPSGQSQEPILLPPSGYVAGLYSRIDSTRGVWKAPAGTEATISGAVGLVTNLTDVQQGSLNLVNINCLRRFASAGIVSWGARTITSDPEWTYVPVRRMAIMLRVSIYNGLQWAVFEPNDEELWGHIRLNLNSFMRTLFRKGAFQGSSASDAFFVKCDSETTTQDDIDLGIVNVQVGFAPLKPAEFVVVQISQKAGQSS